MQSMQEAAQELPISEESEQKNETRLNSVKKYRAMLIDVDNVLADSETAHMKEGIIVFGRHGLDFTEEDHFRYYMSEEKGGTLGVLNDFFVGRYGLTRPFLNRLKDEVFVKKLVYEVPAISDALELLQYLYSNRIPTAAVTSNYNKSTVALLEHLGMDKYIQVIIDHEYILERGLQKKPGGDPYREAARMLGHAWGTRILTEECVGVEDTAKGAISMRRAGVGCRIAYVPDKEKERDFTGEAEPDIIVASLEEIMELGLF